MALVEPTDHFVFRRLVEDARWDGLDGRLNRSSAFSANASKEVCVRCLLERVMAPTTTMWTMLRSVTSVVPSVLMDSLPR